MAKAKEKLTKTDLINDIASESGMSKADVARVLDGQSAVVTKRVKAGHAVVIPGIAKLEKKHRKARDGRNPATGESMRIAAKTVPKATMLKAFKDSI